MVSSQQDSPTTLFNDVTAVVENDEWLAVACDGELAVVYDVWAASHGDAAVAACGGDGGAASIVMYRSTLLEEHMAAPVRPCSLPFSNERRHMAIHVPIP